MTAIRGYVPAANPGGLGVHSLDQFVLAVPELEQAKRFYSDFGLDVQHASDTRAGAALPPGGAQLRGRPRWRSGIQDRGANHSKLDSSAAPIPQASHREGNRAADGLRPQVRTLRSATRP